MCRLYCCTVHCTFVTDCTVVLSTVHLLETVLLYCPLHIYYRLYCCTVHCTFVTDCTVVLPTAHLLQTVLLYCPLHICYRLYCCTVHCTFVRDCTVVLSTAHLLQTVLLYCPLHNCYGLYCSLSLFRGVPLTCTMCLNKTSKHRVFKQHISLSFCRDSNNLKMPQLWRCASC